MGRRARRWSVEQRRRRPNPRSPPPPPRVDALGAVGSARAAHVDGVVVTHDPIRGRGGERWGSILPGRHRYTYHALRASRRSTSCRRRRRRRRRRHATCVHTYGVVAEHAELSSSVMHLDDERLGGTVSFWRPTLRPRRSFDRGRSPFLFLPVCPARSSQPCFFRFVSWPRSRWNFYVCSKGPDRWGSRREEEEEEEEGKGEKREGEEETGSIVARKKPGKSIILDVSLSPCSFLSLVLSLSLSLSLSLPLGLLVVRSRVRGTS